jgi:hypothetical protein
MQHLLSAKTPSRDAGDVLFERIVSACGRVAGFSGYVEEEVVAEDIVVTAGGARAALVAPYPFQAETCPEGRVKACDIHATASACGPGIIDELRRAGFYFLELSKPTGVVVVNTLQFADMRDGLAAWDVVKDWLLTGVAFSGSAKLEITANMQVFGGYEVPPVVPSTLPGQGWS